MVAGDICVRVVDLRCAFIEDTLGSHEELTVLWVDPHEHCGCAVPLACDVEFRLGVSFQHGSHALNEVHSQISSRITLED